MEEKDTYYWELMVRHLSGMASPEEEQELRAYLDARPGKKPLWEELKGLYKRTEETEEPAFDTEAAWRKVRPQLEETRVRRFRGYWWAAASLALLALTASLFFLRPAAEQLQFHTAQGENLEIKLPDGSQVSLNENSSLSYTTPWKGAERRVEMEGEAFFEVEHLAEKVFVVEAQGTETRVLGTSFHVRSGRDEVRVSLLSGKVAFEAGASGQAPHLLDPGDAVRYLPRTGRMEKSRFSNENFLFWKTRRLSFKDERLDSVLAALKKHYGAQFELGDPEAGGLKLTSSFEQRSLEDILGILEQLLDVRFHQKGNTYFVTTNEQNEP